mgnify:CR=1 FL=1
MGVDLPPNWVGGAELQATSPLEFISFFGFLPAKGGERAQALEAAAARVEPPAIICVGRTVLLRQALDWQGAVRDLDPLGTRARSETA